MTRMPTQRTKREKRNAGYTVLDMMVVITILGVLASLGLNQYNKHIARSRRPETARTVTNRSWNAGSSVEVTLLMLATLLAITSIVFCWTCMPVAAMCSEFIMSLSPERS